MKPTSYHVIDKKPDRCDRMVDGIYKNGPQSGHIVKVCIDTTCKKHSPGLPSMGGVTRRQADETRERRIESAARFAVYAELWKVSATKVTTDLGNLRQIARTVYDRAYDRPAAAKAFGWTENSDKAVQKFLDGATAKQLMKFTILMVNAHFLSAYGGKEESLTALKAAVKGWGVDVDATRNATRKTMEAKGKKK